MQSRGPDKADSPYGTVALPAEKNSTGRDPAAATGRAAPDFLLPSLEGVEMRLSDLQGKPVIVNFWASWCTSCREETPSLVKAYEANRAQGLTFIGVNLREAESRAQSFAADWGMAYPVVLDRSGDVAETWRIGGPTSGLPSTYFIDAKGVVQKVVFGTVTDKELAAGLDLIMKAN
jgi:peroxiredoxin